MRLIIVSGLSGSGKSVALHMLEDLGYYCIDNIPVSLLTSFARETLENRDEIYERTAVGVDARNRAADLAAVPELLHTLRGGGIECEVIFLHADQEVLLKRYSETRRKHPLSGAGVSLRDAIERERRLLEPVAAQANLVVDTTRTSVHELRELVRDRVAGRRASQFSLQFESFAFKDGVPADADIVFDVRPLPNPYWDTKLRGLDGRDPQVAAWLEKQPEVEEMFESIADWLTRWLPAFVRTNRSYMTVAIGCTGGQHRSVFFAERLGRHFVEFDGQVLIRHTGLTERTTG